ncbi:formimidoylglutamate deiminase [Sphingobium phenoxybenzoativorans]|uniref:Formimidoylglutamate deiminase n=1 Tax=Sphingobium phenoxybenzoativorans TaxID=1592790 RepID=A0A975KA24_9SPHN|nr:formimidoylglutamate deiminase [Sphingobium phenoxybenzoativorans]QUT06813.1 formimidoylglutamate deiminase [Sphingobium phenoxybenzoativorans]
MTRQADGSFHFATALLPSGWANSVRMEIRDGTISAILPDRASGPEDERHAIALPGLPNLHSHAFQRGMAGLAEKRGSTDDSFWTWRETMYRFVDRLTPDLLQAIAALAYIEMLEAGFTRVGEFHYLHHDRDGAPFGDPATMSAAIIGAAAESGIALTHLPVFYAHSGFGGQVPGEGQRRFIHDTDSFAALLDRMAALIGTLPDAVLGIAPHSLRAVTPDELALLTPLTQGPIHIHVAEQVREVEDCMAWSGARPVEWLLDNMPVDRRWCLVHATHMTPTDTQMMAASGAVAGLCPITEANLGDGLFPAQQFMRDGGIWGIGSDSNVLIDATEELRLLEYGQRLFARGRNILSPAEGSTGFALFRTALTGGAQALGVSAGLAPGNAADFLTLNPDHPSLTERTDDALLDGLIFAAGKSAIDGVWRRGNRLVEGGRHVARDSIASRYRRALGVLLA